MLRLTVPETELQETALRLSDPERELKASEAERVVTEEYGLIEMVEALGRPAHLIGAREWTAWRAQQIVKQARAWMDERGRKR